MYHSNKTMSRHGLAAMPRSLLIINKNIIIDLNKQQPEIPELFILLKYYDFDNKLNNMFQL